MNHTPISRPHYRQIKNLWFEKFTTDFELYERRIPNMQNMITSTVKKFNTRSMSSLYKDSPPIILKVAFSSTVFMKV